MANLTDVYVAASSGEMERAKRCMQWLRDAGLNVVSTWPEVIASIGGDANPRDATHSDRLGYATTDLNQVASAGVLWMLAPTPTGGSGRGAYVELGYAHGLGGKLLVSSGDTKQSIFTALALEFEDDHAALLHIVRTVHEAQQSKLRSAGYYALPVEAP